MRTDPFERTIQCSNKVRAIWGDVVTSKHLFYPPSRRLPNAVYITVDQKMMVPSAFVLNMFMVIMCSCVPAGCKFASLRIQLFGCSEARGSLPHFCVTVVIWLSFCRTFLLLVGTKFHHSRCTAAVSCAARIVLVSSLDFIERCYLSNVLCIQSLVWNISPWLILKDNI